MKVSHTAGKLGLTLPVGLSELQGMKEIQSLAKQLPGILETLTEFALSR